MYDWSQPKPVPRSRDYSFVQSANPNYISGGPLVAQHTSTGISPVFQPASGGGDSYANTGAQTLWIHNNGAVSVTVTIKAQNRCNVAPGFLHDIAAVIAPGGEASMGPARLDIYNDATGYAQITYTSTVGVTVALTYP